MLNTKVFFFELFSRFTSFGLLTSKEFDIFHSIKSQIDKYFFDEGQSKFTDELTT